MSRLPWLAVLLMHLATVVGGGEPYAELTKIDRTIRKEPAYKMEPRYALLVIGRLAEHRAWFVVDGEDVAYLDRNGNGDLTEPGERIEIDQEATSKLRLAANSSLKAMHVFPLGEVGDARLKFLLWVRNPDYDDSRDQPEIHAYKSDLHDRGWMNGSLMRTAADGTQCQTPLALTRQPADAQVCHFLGPLTFHLKWGERQQLEPPPNSAVFDLSIGSPGLPPRGWNRGGFDFSPLTTSEVPKDRHPQATFEIPANASGGDPLRVVLELNQRCCGDTFYNTLQMRPGVTSGFAKVTVSFPLWLEGRVESAEFKVPIKPRPSP